MTAESLRVRVLLRAPTPAEVSEGLDRNPGSRRPAERGWTPPWLEARILRAGDGEVEHLRSLVWRAPGRSLDELAAEDLDHGLEEALRSLRDMEGQDLRPEDVTDREVVVEAAP